MRVAAAINQEDENFFWHFGHCERFKIYDLNNGVFEPVGYINVTGGHGPQRMQAMINYHVDTILCDGIGPGMAQAAPQYGIEVIAGVHGDADTAVKDYLDGNLISDDGAVHCCGQD